MASVVCSGTPSELKRLAVISGADGELLVRLASRLADVPVGRSTLGGQVTDVAADLVSHGRRVVAMAADVHDCAAALAAADRGLRVTKTTAVSWDGGDGAGCVDSILWRARLMHGAMTLGGSTGRALRSMLSLHPITGTRRQFLELDLDGDGQMVEVFGDLSSADAVAVFVPGMGSDLAGFDRHVSEPAAELWLRLKDDYPDRSVAVVAWLGYDAPDDVGEAASTRRASSGGRALADTIERLDLDPEVSVSVVAHSYGSVVAAMALLRNGLEADNVLAMGSPGMVVGHTRDFGSEDTDFFAMAAHDDPLAWSSWFGLAPTFRFTGFDRLAAWGDGHSSYMDRGSVSLGNAAGVVVDEDEALVR